jgi:regulator-associated protein of mTOR
MPTFDSLPQQSYGLAGLQPYPSATSFLAPGNEQPIMFGAMTSIPPPPPEMKTVFDDHQRMEIDVSVASELTKALTDASPLVRFEAVLALNRFVAKYAGALVSVAGDKLGGSSQRNIMAGTGMNPSIPLPSGMSGDTEKSFSDVWTQLIKLYRSEPQPSIRSLLNSIVMSVNERVMSEKSKLRQQRKSIRRQSMFSPSTEESNTNKGDEANFIPQPLGRNTTGTNLSSYSYGSPIQSIKRSGSMGMSIGVGTPPKGLQDASGFFSTKGPQTSSTLTFVLATEPEPPCPESKFYLWKKIEAAKRQQQALDLLSDIGAIRKYRSTRNLLVQQKGQLLKDSFAILAQKPPSSSPFDTSSSDLASGVESEIDMKKEAMNLHQSAVLQNNSARGTTSLLRFHPYEPALVVCGSSDVTCWNAETSERTLAFSNDNPKNTRMTAASWINESNTSLFLTGCSDGSVRIWDGVFEPNDEMSKEKPTLVSSFFALSDLVADRGSTGLILSYQSCGGQLIAGGNSKQLKCWDIESEKCRNAFETKSDAMLTTLTSAWNHSLTDGYSGLGPDIIIGGFSNGALKLYDTRSNDGVPAIHLKESRNSAVKRRLKYTEFEEHSSWIIDVAFTNFGGRHEVRS